MEDTSLNPALEQKLLDIAKQVPFLLHNGISVSWIRQDRVQVEVDLAQIHENGVGGIHGGLLFTISDSSAALACRTNDCKYVTQSTSFTFLRPAVSGRIFAESQVIHRSRNMAAAHVQVRNEAGKLLADGTFNMFRVPEDHRVLPESTKE